jgi:Suppressor of fused protein (SUFU)
MFLQTGVVLFDRCVALDELAACLVGQLPERRIDKSLEAPYWVAGEGCLMFESASGSNGGVAVELFHRAWPDSMGGPETDPELFMAWSMRQFGLATFPFGLARAGAQSAAPSSDHVAFVKLSLSYIFGADEDAQVSPEDRDVSAELARLAALAAPVLGLDGAVAWFAPNGEVLTEPAVAREKLLLQAAGEHVPDLWVSTRAYSAGKHWLVETVGVGTLGAKSIPYDHQVLLPDLGLDGDVVIRFVQELSGAARFGSSELPSEPVLGPGGRWTPRLATSENPPPREVVRWVHESEADHTVSIAEVSDEHAQRWSAHLERHLGGVSTVFHELLSDTIHLDVLVFPATTERPFHALVTQGMSALPMTVPEGAEDVAYAELMVVLPPNWMIEGEEAKEERWYWPMRMLKSVARLPHLYETWIGFGHTIPNGDPPEPYDESTEQCCVIAAPAVMFGEDVASCELADGKIVRLYSLVPIYEDEMRFKLEHASEALFEKLSARGVGEVIDPARRSALGKRFWVV